MSVKKFNKQLFKIKHEQTLLYFQDPKILHPVALRLSPEKQASFNASSEKEPLGIKKIVLYKVLK